jgi:aldose sugar dehydrogenase
MNMPIHYYLSGRISQPPLLSLVIFIAVILMGVLCIQLLYDDFSFAAPTVNDSRLEVQTVSAGLRKPTDMAFLGPDDILVLEKEKGTVQRIKNGIFLPEPVLKANINSTNLRGMLGIDATKVSDSLYYLFVYYTEASKNGTAIGNRLYRYIFEDDSTLGGAQGQILDTKLLLDLPVDPGPSHNGGKVLVGPHGGVNLIVGEVERDGKAQNIVNGSDLDGSGGILVVNQNGGPIREIGLFGNTHPANKYVAYGIRNSFGMDYDPMTEKIWITENGPTSDDEINLVNQGFNSGWKKIMGMAPAVFNFSSLVTFNGTGEYRDPEYLWKRTVAPTALHFLNSTTLGTEYEYDMFVGDINNGRIYRFDLTENRTALSLEGVLSDKVADTDSENQNIIFARGFGGITDLETGPKDGNLYVLSFPDGAIYKIVPKVNVNASASALADVYASS